MIDAALAMRGLCGLLDAVREGNVERGKYELWLHRVWDRSYDEFSRQADSALKPRPVLTEARQVSIINRSLAIAGLSYAEGVDR